MSLPKWNDFLLPILQQMKNGEDYRRNSEELRSPIRKIMIEKFKITQNEMDEKIKSGDSKFDNRLSWAFTFLIKAEYIEKSLDKKFYYKITDLGMNAMNDIVGNDKILDEAYLKSHSPNYIKNWNVSQITIDSQTNISEESEEEEFNLEDAIDEIKQDTEQRFIEKLRNLPWEYFEDFCAKLIEKMGYGVASKRDIRVKDGGIDGIIYTDELGIRDKIYIQAKRYNDGNVVSSKDLQAFLHILSKNKAKGIFITTSKFSSDANEVARDDEKSGNIALIDYKKLIRLCSKYKCGFKVKTVVEILDVDL